MNFFNFFSCKESQKFVKICENSINLLHSLHKIIKFKIEKKVFTFKYSLLFTLKTKKYRKQSPRTMTIAGNQLKNASKQCCFQVFSISSKL